MRVTGKAPAVGTVATDRLQHAVGFHSSPEHLLPQLVALAGAAAARGEQVALAVAPHTADALRHALGGNGDALHVLATTGQHTGSGQTAAMARARELRQLTARAGRVTVLAEHRSELDGPDGSFWTEFDAAVNVALADLPVGLTCFYPEMPLHLSVLDGARCNHPQVLVDGELRHNPDHRPPREVLERHPVPAPVLLGAPDLRLEFQAWQLQDVRRSVRALATASGFDDDRVDDVVLAVNEVATNAVEHGGSPRSGSGYPGSGSSGTGSSGTGSSGTKPSGTGAELSVWARSDGLVCEVHDRGPLADPLPGLLAPHPSDPRGRGLWIARQLCDLLHVWTDGGGTHVRIRAAP